MGGGLMTVPPMTSSRKDNRGARRNRAAPRPYKAARSTPVLKTSAPLSTGMPSDRIHVASVPAPTSMDARSSGRGAITSPPPASQADVRASPSAFVTGASVGGAKKQSSAASILQSRPRTLTPAMAVAPPPPALASTPDDASMASQRFGG